MKVDIAFSPTALATAKETADQSVNYANTLIVRNDSDAKQAQELILLVKGEAKALEEKRVAVTGPLNQSLREVNGWFKPVLERLKLAEDTLKRAVSNYLLAQKEEQARQFAAAVTSHQQGDHALAREQMALANSAAAVTAPQGIGVREVWQCRVVDASAVPREWCIPDEKRLAAVARATPSDCQPVPIPGVEFFKNAIVTARSK